MWQEKAIQLHFLLLSKHIKSIDDSKLKVTGKIQFKLVFSLYTKIKHNYFLFTQSIFMLNM
ncbi:hypothetical protein BK130_18175 [Viridibacillus sp. FSL H8-0123]|uniref:Uncharacterized protein n=1 Tax=Viridibacillus arenosi FSL R5-213 TaxID=1227360 RepID=W4ELR5_9BACL|nr:hypothetical protein C176_18682 [Viridibacillus arenosi FSL R5-213]OMC80008.1 hypothetical protein BK130_18175 [Viridibacillus sp. FSL H8-0123]OMC84290.1 hypothetical protein BK128_17075 [Viridibacillus sp. FSL H7-0596]OMC89710.1 hypothetical protein BK137_16685 [Viridibacillus arenosi]